MVRDVGVQEVPRQISKSRSSIRNSKMGSRQDLHLSLNHSTPGGQALIDAAKLRVPWGAPAWGRDGGGREKSNRAMISVSTFALTGSFRVECGKMFPCFSHASSIS